MSERLKEHAWKACNRETGSGVRIPPSPPVFMQTYRALTGRIYDLTILTPEEKAFFRKVIDLYRRGTGWSEFDSAWISLGQSTIWAGKAI